MRLLTFSNCDLIESQGSGYVILNFARGLEARGHGVTLLDPRDCVLWPGRRKARSLRLALGLWRSASRLVRETNPDLVEFYGGEAWLATARLNRIPDRRFKIVAHSNGIEPLVEETLQREGIPNTASGKKQKWYQGRLRFPVEKAFTRADAIVTVSQPEADFAIRRGFQPSDRVLKIENALSDDFLGQPFGEERPKTVGFCGSWLARKGVALLTADMIRVLDEAPDWNLHLVGVGRDFRVADHFPSRLAGRVVVTGFVTDKAELRRIYQSWSIALMPSAYESFGLVAAESMACGCALVANRTGFAAGLRDGQEALLLPKLRTPHLRDAVVRLILDASLRRQIARAGWCRVQPLCWRNSVDQLESFYQSLLTGAA